MNQKYEPGLRVSEYVLEERIGQGTFGDVWRARHHIWDETVAIKLPTEPEYVRYLRREGLVVHGLRHPNIVGVKGLDPYADIPYLIMELVKGPSLRQVIDEHPNGLPIESVLAVARGILEAMKVAHAANVLHRDLKPGNVLLNLDGKAIEEIAVEQVKISDFGLGSNVTDTLRSIAQSASMERDNKIVGTLAYMASEIRDGRQQPDAKSDLYSIGVIIFETLTGERPAGAELPSTIRANTPDALDEIFRRLYARHDRRYESAEAVLDDLNSRLAPAAPPATGARLPPIPQAGSRQTCSSCGNPIEPFDQFCTRCGRQVVEQVRKCMSCGAFPGPQDKFCIFCGAQLAAFAE